MGFFSLWLCKQVAEVEYTAPVPDFTSPRARRSSQLSTSYRYEARSYMELGAVQAGVIIAAASEEISWRTASEAPMKYRR